MLDPRTKRTLKERYVLVSDEVSPEGLVAVVDADNSAGHVQLPELEEAYAFSQESLRSLHRLTELAAFPFGFVRTGPFREQVAWAVCRGREEVIFIKPDGTKAFRASLCWAKNFSEGVAATGSSSPENPNAFAFLINHKGKKVPWLDNAQRKWRALGEAHQGLIPGLLSGASSKEGVDVAKSWTFCSVHTGAAVGNRRFRIIEEFDPKTGLWSVTTPEGNSEQYSPWL